MRKIQPKVFELGLKGPPSAVARVPGVYHPTTADVASQQQPSMQYDLRTGQYIRAPRSPEEVSCCCCCCCCCNLTWPRLFLDYH
jgi:hypothetical protein